MRWRNHASRAAEMANVQRVSRRNRLDANSQKAARQVVVWIVGMLAFGTTVFFFRQRAGLLPWQRIPPYAASVDRAKPLPKTLPPQNFTDPRVARGYEIANRIPEILVQQPSYCRFVPRHHHSLLECFSTNDAARTGCEVCLQEAYLVDHKYRAGKSAAEIRASIVAGEWKSMNLDEAGWQQ